MGFFADVGPLTVFISHQVRIGRQDTRLVFIPPFFVQLIHPDLRFDPNSNPPSFASDEQVRLANISFLSIRCMRIARTDLLYLALNFVLDHREKYPCAVKNCRHTSGRHRDCAPFPCTVPYHPCH